LGEGGLFARIFVCPSDEADFEYALIDGTIDKAVDTDWLRSELDARGAAAVIPPKANRKAVISFDRDMYRWRHLIENIFAKLKEFRAVATRNDKPGTSYTATVHLAAAVTASR
jgi:transposase